MKGLVVNLLVGGGLFAGALAASLAATGRLNRDGMASIPGLSALLPSAPSAGTVRARGPAEPAGGDGPVATAADSRGAVRSTVEAAHAEAEGAPAQGEGHAAPAGERRLKTGRSVDQPERDGGDDRGEPGDAASRGGQAPAGARMPKTGRSVAQPGPGSGGSHGAEPGASSAAAAQGPAPRPSAANGRAAATDLDAPADGREEGYRPGSYFRFEGMPAGVTAEQLNAAWQRVREVTAELEHRRTALDLREREVGALAEDIARRQSELGRERTELEALQKRLDERIEQFREQVKLVRADEVAALKRNAATLAAFEPQKAAELVQEQWKTEQGQDEVLKAFEFMDKDAVNSILEQLPNSMVREVLEKRLHVVKETPATGGKGG